MKGPLAALGAASLFGGTAPAAKVLVASASPLLVAGIMYLGSGLGLLVALLARRARGVAMAPIPRAGRLRFAGSVLAGGVAGPALLMLGLSSTPASTSSLLLNLEGVITALLAWLVFKEHLHTRIVAGFAAIALGGVVLTVDTSASFALSPGAVFVVTACACWAIDNNLTQAVSSADPVVVATLKGLAAGITNTALALVVEGAALPSAQTVGTTLIVGFFGYGVSQVLFVIALRELGTARTGAYFSVAPFVGAVASLVALDEPLTSRLAIAGALMATGVLLQLTERHSHEHAHEALEHTHAHAHDEHHQHAHADGSVLPEGVVHTHAHVHAPLVHTHAHTPDIHHRHRH